jgi:hypothetical protein
MTRACHPSPRSRPAMAQVAIALMTGAMLLAALLAGAPRLLAADGDTAVSPVEFSLLRKTERNLDALLERVDATAPMEVIGSTRAVYVAGTGMVYSLEVSLAPAVGISPFFTKVPPAEVERIRQAKLARVPVLRDLLLGHMPELAVILRGLPASEDLVLGATMFYFPYENLEGLPRQIIVRGKAGELRKLHSSREQSKAAQVAAISNVTTY